MKMEPIVSSETSAIRTQTPGNYPKRNNLHLEHGESLRTIMTSSSNYPEMQFQLRAGSTNVWWISVFPETRLTFVKTPR